MKESRFQPVMQPQAPTVRRRTRRRGIALAWVALTLIIMLGIVGLSLDWARGALVAHQLHNGADAGSLAGALVVKVDWPRAMSDAIAIAHLNAADQLPIAVAPNSGNDPAGEVVVGRWVRQLHQFFPTTIAPNAVKVWADRSGSGGDAPAISLLFGPIFGTQTVDIRRHAIAQSTGQRGAGILVLSHDPELDFTTLEWTYKDTGMVSGGGPIIDLRGPDDIVGDIQINSNGNGTGGGSEKDAFVFNGTSADIHAGNFNVVGTSNPAFDDHKWDSLQPPSPEIPFSVNIGVDYMEDPLQNVPAPDVSTMTVWPGFTDTITDATIVAKGTVSPTDPGLMVLEIEPGYYPGGVQLSGTGGGYRTELRLKMGTSVETSVFAFGGAADGKTGLRLSGGANLIGNGVMIYITGAHTVGGTTYNVKNGTVDFGGHGYIEISPPGDYFLVDGERQINGLPGISMWQDRGPAGDPPPGPFNTNTVKLGGTANYNLTGTLYFGYNPVVVSGNISKAGNQLLAGALDASGGLSLGIAYDGRNRENWTGSLLVE